MKIVLGWNENKDAADTLGTRETMKKNVVLTF